MMRKKEEIEAEVIEMLENAGGGNLQRIHKFHYNETCSMFKIILTNLEIYELGQRHRCQ